MLLLYTALLGIFAALVWCIIELRGVSKRLEQVGARPGGQDPPNHLRPIGRSADETPGPEHHWVPSVAPRDRLLDISKQGGPLDPDELLVRTPKERTHLWKDASEQERAEFDHGILLPSGEFVADPTYRE
jgi:hypothetical protein